MLNQINQFNILEENCKLYLEKNSYGKDKNNLNFNRMNLRNI